MAFSNGYDITAVLTALKDRVGFRQPTGTGAPTLTSAVTTSNSGRFFQDFHALVTVENIKSTMEQSNATDAELITYLTNKRNASIMKALQLVFNEPQVIDQPNKLFTREGVNDQLITNTGLFAGYEIEVADKADAALQIDALHLYFDGAATFNIYLFKDGKIAAEWAQEVTTVANEITEVVLSEKILKQGKYFLGYFQNDLGSVKAIQEQVDDWTETFLFEAEAMQAASTGATTFNRNGISYPSQPMGINIEASSFIDHTTQIKRKPAMFDELIGLIFTYDVMEQGVYSARSNSNERIQKDTITQIGMQLDMNGVAAISDSPRVPGLKQRIEKEAARVRKTFYPTSKAVTVCL